MQIIVLLIKKRDKMTNHLVMRNFGPIKNARLAIKPITILIGPNNSGKSFFVLTYHTISQIISNIGSELRFLGIKGRKLDIHSLLDSEFRDDFIFFVFSRIKSIIKKEYSGFMLYPYIKRIVEGDLKLGIEEKETVGENKIPENVLRFLEESVRKLADMSFSKKSLCDKAREKIYETFRIEPNELIRWNQKKAEISFENAILKLDLTIQESRGRTSELSLNLNFNSRDIRKRTKKIISDPRLMQMHDRDILFPLFDNIKDIPEKEMIEHITRNYLGVVLSTYFDILLGDIDVSLFIPGGRSGLIKAHDVITASIVRQARRIGLEETHIPGLSDPVANFIADLLDVKRKTARGPYSIRKQKANIQHFFDKIDTNLLEGKLILDDSFEETTKPLTRSIYYRSTLKGSKLIPIQSVSSAISEIAGIRLFLESNRFVITKSRIIIEEPEIHLHPQMQINLMRILIRLSKISRGVIITTHSDYLLQQLNISILENTLKKLKVDIEFEEPISHKDVSVLWMDVDGKGTTIGEKVEVSKEGLEATTFLNIINKLGNETSYLMSLVENITEDQKNKE